MIWFLAGAVAASIASFLVLLLDLVLLMPARRVRGPLTREQLAEVATVREIGYQVFDRRR